MNMTNGDAIRMAGGLNVTDRYIAKTMQAFFSCEACDKGPHCERAIDGCEFALLDRLKAPFSEQENDCPVEAGKAKGELVTTQSGRILTRRELLARLLPSEMTTAIETCEAWKCCFCPVDKGLEGFPTCKSELRKWLDEPATV